MNQQSLSEESIFGVARRIASLDARNAYLAQVCGGDQVLHARVVALLEASPEGTRFLESPPSALVANPRVNGAQPLTEEGRGSVIGPYKLLEQIGEGGMGVVFMAEQTRPVQRRVALKIIKAGMDTREVVARFEAERQALAMMDHPNIARVLDAGATDTGRPYFVMELVRGVPMTEFCNQKNLSIRERLELFVTVCQAVQHAHQKGIIHRDIKPTNVLVTLHDGRPVIKVIDFGVAKATGQKLTDKTLFTGFTQMIGTPLYMSPEQAEMSEPDIDTRSDIFSAGVLLYELLTGTTPFDSQRLKSASFDELRRIIREEEPPRPSTRLTTLALEAASTVGTQRKSDPRQLTRLFRGELDWIVMKCLEKDRTRRYETASALAGDVERYLHDEPVQACPPSARYRFGKFARRNKAALGTVAAVIVALILGTVVSTWQAIRASNAEAHANTSAEQALIAAESERKAKETETVQRKRAEEIAKLLVSVLRSPDPDRDGRTITIAEVLDRSAKELQGKFAGDPPTKAKLLQAVGESYVGLGLFRESIPLLEQARDLCSASLGREHSDTIDAMATLAGAYRAAGLSDEAVRLDEEVLKLRKARPGPDQDSTLNAMFSLSEDYFLLKRIDEAVQLKEEALKLGKAALGTEDPRILTLVGNLAVDYQRAGSHDKAIALMEEALNVQKTKLGPDHADTASTMGILGEIYVEAGRFDEGIHLLEEALKLRKAKLGPEHRDTLDNMYHLYRAYADAGRINDAISLAEESLKLHRLKIGPEHPDVYVTMSDLAGYYGKSGRIDEAIRLSEETVKLVKSRLGSEDPGTLYVMRKLAVEYGQAGEALIHQGKNAEAAAEFVRALDSCKDEQRWQRRRRGSGVSWRNGTRSLTESPSCGRRIPPVGLVMVNIARCAGSGRRRRQTTPR